MSDLATGRGGWATARHPAVHNTAPDDRGSPVTGRHAFDEDAVLTPIFHSLSRGGWRSRQHDRAVDPVDEFRRDPLAAPIPITFRESAHLRG